METKDIVFNAKVITPFGSLGLICGEDSRGVFVSLAADKHGYEFVTYYPPDQLKLANETTTQTDEKIP